MKFSILKFKISILFLACSSLANAQRVDSLDIKIGQMILIGFPKAEVDPIVLSEIKQGKVGTIILFEKNIPKSTASFSALKKIIWTYQKAAPIPLFVAIDQEGGKVNRLKDKYGFPRSITAQEMGRSVDSVKFYAESIASNLAGLGININFAPCVDLGVNKNNTVIYAVGRSFSANPDTVALYAEAYIKPHRKFGVITVLKHFPGHGSSLADTHVGVADVTKTWSVQELIPYQRLLDKEMVDGIMSAHIVNAELDQRKLPGTLSSRMIDSLLRKTMRYDGVVFSDDMQMHAITKQYGMEEAIKLAIHAGVDILCFSNNIMGSEVRTVDKVHEIIRKLVENETISKERIDESFERIMKLKGRLSSSPEEYYRVELIKAKAEFVRQQQLAESMLKRVREMADEARKEAEIKEQKQNKSKRKKSKKQN
jgi:beta-N-acetylhexosaminidase